jgi:hypothetical protein
MMGALLLLPALIVAGCSPTESHDPTDATSAAAGALASDEASPCSRRGGMPVVWASYLTRVGDRIVPDVGRAGWPIDDSTFVVMSSYWALTRNDLFQIDAAASNCVDPHDRWVVVAEAPGTASGNSRWPYPDDPEPSPVDATLWDRVTANPWRLDAIGPPGEPGEQPYYAGVAQFSDQTVVTSAACDTRINFVRFIGDALVPIEWPESSMTMICVPPPGIDPLPEERSAEWYLSIGGILQFDGNALVITYNGVEYRYVAISDDEFAAEFNRSSFTTVKDPLRPLGAHLLD